MRLILAALVVLCVSSVSEAQTTANLWVDGAGTCTRQGTPAAYNDAAACSSLAAALTASSCGDSILVKDGSYTTGQLIKSQSCGGGNTTIQPENAWPVCDKATLTCTKTGLGSFAFDGSDDTLKANWPVIISGLDTDNDIGIDYVTFSGFYVEINTGASSQPDSRGGYGIKQSSNVIVEEFVIGGGIVGDSQNITIRDTFIGPCHETPIATDTCGNGQFYVVDGVTFEDNFVHDFRTENTVNGSGDGCYEGATDCGHWEGLFLNTTEDMTIRRNRFRNIVASANIYITIFNNSPLKGHVRLLIENNWMEPTHNGCKGCQTYTQPSLRTQASGIGHCEGTTGTDYEDVIIRNNSVAPSGAIDIDYGTGSACDVVGDLLYSGNVVHTINDDGDTSCETLLETAYNIIIGGTLCNAATATGNSTGHAAGDIFTNATVGASLDLTLKSGTNAAVDFVPIALCPLDDFLGNPRSGSFCDAGAFERQAGAASEDPRVRIRIRGNE